MILADSHTHTSFSSDSKAAPRSQIESAIQKGLNYLCVTDHEDMDYYTKGEFLIDLPAYIQTLTQLRKEYQSQINLGIGIELGLQPHLADQLPGFAFAYPFDFIIGSSHMVGQMDPYYPEFWKDRQERQGILAYFEQTLENILTFDCFDVYGHIDYIVRYCPDPDFIYRYEDYQEILDEILKTLIEKGKGIECNTGGFKYGLGHPNPEEKLLSRYIQLGGEILTIGSDAHAPEHIAYSFKRLPELLTSCGVRYYTVFKNRKPVFYPL